MAVTIFSLCVLFGAAFLGYPLLRRFHSPAFFVLALAPTAAFVGFLWLLPSIIGGLVVHWSVPWIPQFDIALGFRIDLLSEAFALLVTGAGALILFYCAHYFERSDEGVPRFGFNFLLFAGSMLGLVIADDVYLMFMFWELTTVMSFLLVGHFGFRRASRSAAMQALIITTLGGLAMFVGLVILSSHTGTSSFAEILSAHPRGIDITVAVYLLLAGAVTKSAIFPFHFWLPGAMAAPTPVSAYLHAAAMVKAGVYLIARIGPEFGDTPGFRVTLISLGGITMLLGALRALRQYDLKLILAFGTVSQLGMLMLLYGVADPRADAGATALVFAHALSKAPLFLAVGIIEHRTGTRDLRNVNGLAKTMPILTVTTFLAVLSMIGFPPMFGFVAKEAALSELFAIGAEPAGATALVILVVGNALTVAYMLRFFIGAFGNTRGKPLARSDGVDHWDLQIAPIVFVVLALLAGVFANKLAPVYEQIRPGGHAALPLELWHGITPALVTTVAVFIIGALVLWRAGVSRTRLVTFDEKYSAGHMYFIAMRAFDLLAVRLTTLTQRGSLPFYLSIIFLVFLSVVGGTFLANSFSHVDIALFTNPVQIGIVALMIVGAIATLVAKKRFQAVVYVGLTGYAMAAMFAQHGAPDLAVTQVLVETMTLVTFVLVIRRLPQRLDRTNPFHKRLGRLAIGTALGVLMGLLVIVALGARGVDPVSVFMPDLAVSGGHGANVVNVTLVDIRGWDTLGELSVVVVAATGIASMVFLSTRSDNLPKISRRKARSDAHRYLLRVADPNDPAERGHWVLAGRTLSPERRSIILEVVVRLIFHALLILSLYVLLVGHNNPGGGFAAGLIAGAALIARYLAGGAAELGATVPFDAGRIVGSGLFIAAVTAGVPLLFGMNALTSSWLDITLGPFGEVSLVSSAVFDVGVYLVVFGLVLDVLRSLGSQIDVHAAEAEGVKQ
jgi:multicomponent Na+:H+ antiporter subunit A